MDYHIFKKATKSKNKLVHRWYYYYNDVVTGKKIQRVCNLEVSVSGSEKNNTRSVYTLL